MNIEYTGRGTTWTPKLRHLAETEFERIDAIIGHAVSAHVILTEDKHRRHVEVTLEAAAETLVAVCEGTDMQVELHAALRKIEQQAVKHKERRLTAERAGKPENAAPLVELPPVEGV